MPADCCARHTVGPRRLIGPLLLLVTVLVPIGWFLPLFTARIPLLVRNEVSVASGLVELWSLDLVLFTFVLVFAVLAPLLKTTATAWAWYRVPRERASVWLERLSLLGKLSMTEIFLLATIIVGFKGVGIGRVEVSWGLWAFTFIALASYFTSLWARGSLRSSADAAT